MALAPTGEPMICELPVVVPWDEVQLCITIVSQKLTHFQLAHVIISLVNNGDYHWLTIINAWDHKDKGNQFFDVQTT